jgi:hypothetical protein
MLNRFSTVWVSILPLKMSVMGSSRETGADPALGNTAESSSRDFNLP